MTGKAPAIAWTPADGAPGAFRVGHSLPNGHPADGMTAQVCIGGGAYMSIINPASFEDGGPEWTMRYGNVESIRYTVASLLSSYDYLLSEAISMKEATSRLRLLRTARRNLAAHDGTGEASA